MGHPTWLSPFAQVWRERYDADPNWGVLAKALRPIADRTDAAERFRYYLSQTPAQYLNVFKFATTYGEWMDPEAPKPGESVDAYIQRLCQ